MDTPKKNSLITYLFAVINLLVSAALIIFAVWQENTLFYINSALADTDIIWGLGIFGVILLLISLFTLWTGLKPKNQLRHTLIKTGDLGEINITLEAINNLISKASKNIKGVKDVKPRIKTLSEGIAIYLKVVINPDLNITDTTVKLQNSIADYLYKYGGINVLEIKIIVESIKSHNKVSRVD
jgi:uncharacterized alkaline shock family protein YloU